MPKDWLWVMGSDTGRVEGWFGLRAPAAKVFVGRRLTRGGGSCILLALLPRGHRKRWWREDGT